jgi:hypothetical protein
VAEYYPPLFVRHSIYASNMLSEATATPILELPIVGIRSLIFDN